MAVVAITYHSNFRNYFHNLSLFLYHTDKNFPVLNRSGYMKSELLVQIFKLLPFGFTSFSTSVLKLLIKYPLYGGGGGGESAILSWVFFSNFYQHLVQPLIHGY